MATVPRIIDIRDNLERAREESDGDIDDELDAVEEQIAEYTERTETEGTDEEGVLDTVDNRLLKLETRADGAVEEQLHAARNRIHLFRNARSGAVDGVSVIDVETRFADAGTDKIEDDAAGEEVEFWVVLANDGEERSVTVEIPFYRDDEEVTRVRGESIRLGANVQETVTLITDVPQEAEYYTVDIDTTDSVETSSSVTER
ncbi:DUF7553 family protein [Halopelagius longus]|uniref:CARDB protein n=1 Tax=Halopelagius longus TaxID=1236180 RepID=A0A1H1GM48_9EURY|nr:CARDB domain-containing protein [Halopelagius longus]RDI69660.1 hypothetical protein DWB78_17980 [Halopelagius longus]SDR14255.1 CARDB protein [Halopelagius longus]